MARLIDADNLKKDIAKLHVLHDEKEIRRLYYANPHTSLADFEEILVRVFDAIEAAPTINAVEAVRCRECMFSKVYQNDSSGVMGRFCEAFTQVRMVSDDDFCSYGERRDHERHDRERQGNRILP